MGLIDGLSSELTQVSTRLGFVETNIAPPNVVTWEAFRQLGTCTPKSCRYSLSYSRTDYGEGCGLQSVSAEMRLNTGQVFALTLSDYTPVASSRSMLRVVVPLDVPAFVPDGRHEWRMIATYPTCSWSRELIPRKVSVW